MKREIIIDGDIARVPLTRGFTTIIDACDVHLVQGYNWTATPAWDTFYAYRKQRVDGKQCIILMHRVILGINDSSVRADHRDLDGLNNRRTNLRACSNAENGRNRGAQNNNTSGLKGVYGRGGRWRAEIASKGVRKHLGYFANPEAAHAAYCAAAAKMHGEFARGTR